MAPWDPQQYLRFAQQRTQPCVDLLARLEIEDVKYAVDLGCGPGNSTALLAKKFPDATVIGLDNSAAMIERARVDCPGLIFQETDVSSWISDQPCDVILSNAVFQWLPKHDELMPRLLSQMRPGGVLAVQMPRNFQSPVHRILRELAADQRWAAKIDPREPYWVQPPAFYYDVLAPICQRIDIWETEYIHVMEDHEAIVEWYKGTGLRPYLQAISVQEQQAFIGECLERFKAAYPRQKDGRVLFPFLRIFLVAVR